MSDILSSILPIVLIIFIGFIIGKTLTLDHNTLSRLILYVLFPALITDKLYHATVTKEDAIAMILGFTLTYLILGLIAWNIGRFFKLSIPLKKSLVATTTLSNSGNMGLPVILFFLGEEGLERAIIYLIAWNLIVLSTMPGFLQNGGFLSSIRLTLKLPLIWCILFGISLNQLNIQLPWRLGEGLHLLSGSAIPVALLLLGIQISTSQLQLSRYEIGASLMRLWGGFIIAYTVGQLLGFDQLDLKVLVLQSAMPTAVTAFVMVNEFGGETERTARVVVISTLLSFFSLPIILWIVQTWN